MFALSRHLCPFLLYLSEESTFQSLVRSKHSYLNFYDVDNCVFRCVILVLALAGQPLDRMLDKSVPDKMLLVHLGLFRKICKHPGFGDLVKKNVVLIVHQEDAQERIIPGNPMFLTTFMILLHSRSRMVILLIN